MSPAYWPLFDLRLRTPHLDMRVYREDDIPALIEAAKSGIHDPADMPFGVAWTDVPSPELEHNFFGHYWKMRAAHSPEHWALPFAVFLGGELVGVQALHSDAFPTQRSAWSGSWLRADRQGRGIGKEMRTAVLVLAFDGLGADQATSESNLGNEASKGVSQGLGYEENGRGRLSPRGEPVETIRWRLTRERFEELRTGGHYEAHEPVEIEGLEPCLPLLGLGD